MKVAGRFASKTCKFALGALTIAAFSSVPQASAQAPYLIPYTIQVLAGGGTAPTAGDKCTGTNGVTGTAFDAVGDGCPVSSSSVVVATGGDLHDVAVDPQGNIYFIDNQSNGVVRRIDARSGIVTIYSGTAGSQPTIACPTFYDKYGDGCQANDGMGNVPVSGSPYQYTEIAKSRGLGVAKNGDVYIADYTGNAIHKITLATGTQTLEAGYIVGNKASSGSTSGYTGDGGPAEPGTSSSAYVNGGGSEVASPRGVGVDAAGNVYIADTGNSVIRKVTAATGIISTIIGAHANPGSTGDGGPASAALISAPEDIQVDSFGNMYIADFGNAKVRMVYAGGATAANLISKTNGGLTPVAGDIYTIMGGGAGTYTAGTIVIATSVPVGSPRKVGIDARGNVYLADNGNNVIWFLDATTGYMRVIAGTFGSTSGGAGCAASADAYGDNCPGTAAVLSANSDMGVGLDAQGDVYLTDTGHKLLREVYTNQVFPTEAAGGNVQQVLQVHFAAGDGPAANAPFVLSGSADYSIANTSCQAANADGTTDCLLTVTFTPSKAGIDNATLTVASTANGSSSIGLSGVGTAAALALDPGTTSSFATGLNAPQGIAQDASGTTYIADTGNNRVLRYTGAGTMTVMAGTGTSGDSGDGGLATAATLNHPRAVTVARDGAIYIADTGNNVVRRVDPVNGTISVYGGGAATVCTLNNDSLGDGCPATSATFSAPSGLAADGNGNVYVSDTGNNLIRELTRGGYAVLVAGGASTVCATGDTFGNGCTALNTKFNGPTGLRLDAQGNLYIADTGSNEVRELTAQNTVADVAGNGQAGGAGNGGPATGAQLSGPTGVAVDAGGNVYIADTGNSAIRVVNPGGNINVVAGTLNASGTGTLPGSAYAVQLNSPSSVVSNGLGTLVVLDSGNNRAFTDTRGAVSYNFGRVNLGDSSPTLQIVETSTGSATASLGPQGSTMLFTPSGDTASFTVMGTGSNGCTAAETLAPGSACLLAAQFTPSMLGQTSATYTDMTGNSTINSPVPFIQLTGTGSTLTPTSSKTVITTPATGSPQYQGPFVVTTTVTPASCNTGAPSCFPTGTVTFFADGVQVGAAVPVSATGTASQSIPGLTVGTHSIVAVYSGDDFYGTSTAPALSVTLTQGTTTTVVTASANPAVQFNDLTLTAMVTTAIANRFPTGTVSFYAGTTLLAKGPVDATTGIATISDLNYPNNKPPVLGNSFGLTAGTYNITAVYSGDANYASSTSAPYKLTISPQAATFTVSLSVTTTGTAQGSTALTTATITPNNTLSGTLTFACMGLPTDSTCTFGPPSNTLTFVPIATRAPAQTIQVTLWTNVPPGVVPTATSSRAVRPGLFGRGKSEPTLAGLLGWPVLLLSLIGLAGFRKQMREMRLLTVLALFGLLAGGSAVLTGCSQTTLENGVTPVGKYTVQFIATGPGGTSVTTPITFTVTQGAAGQE